MAHSRFYNRIPISPIMWQLIGHFVPTERWEFDGHGLMSRRIASINDAPIKETERKYHWPLGRRPDDHPSLSDLGF